MLPRTLPLRSIVHSQPAWLYTPKPALKRLSWTLLSMLSSTLPIALDDTLLAYLTMRSQVSSQDAPKYTVYVLKYTPRHAPMDAHTCTWWQPACLTVHYQTGTHADLKHTPGHAFKYSSNSTRWYTPSLLGSMLPSTLSRVTTLPISLDYMLTCTLLHAWSRDLLSCRNQARGGVSCRHQAVHQQNVKWFGSQNSMTQLFWPATPILPEAPRSSRTGWMQNDVPLRCSGSTCRCSSTILT